MCIKVHIYILQVVPDAMIRQGSIDDINAQQFLKISNYEDTVRQLDIYYAIGSDEFYNNNNFISNHNVTITNTVEPR